MLYFYNRREKGTLGVAGGSPILAIRTIALYFRNGLLTERSMRTDVPAPWTIMSGMNCMDDVSHGGNIPAHHEFRTDDV